MLEIFNLRIKRKLSFRIFEAATFFIVMFAVQYFCFSISIKEGIFSCISSILFMMFILNPILNKFDDWSDKRKQRKISHEENTIK
jgi:hypothetical protein